MRRRKSPSGDFKVLKLTHFMGAPFRDGLDIVADAGATSIIQPGGSIRDKEVIEAANERGITMVFTAIRHFRH